MADRKTQNAKQIAGILQPLTGSINGLVVTKTGVMYMRSIKKSTTKK